MRRDVAPRHDASGITMRIGIVVGTVTLSRWHPALAGGCYKVVEPLSLENLRRRQPPEAEELIVYDELGAGVGSLVAFTEGREAAHPFLPQDKPVDAYNAAILDEVQV
jgi:microcompartment protein CcmK/EutM